MRLRTRILMDAREMIANRDLWTQGSMESADDPPRRCLSGAICAAADVPEHQIESNTTTADVLALVSEMIQKRKDGKAKLDKFINGTLTADDGITNADWLVAFNDHSQHPTVINLLDEAIAQTEPCSDCQEPLSTETWHFLRIDETDKVLCDVCSTFYG